MDQILSGEKGIEYKEYNDFWQKRISKNIENHKVINFLCGRNNYKFKINFITYTKTPNDLKDIIKTNGCFAIYLGHRIK